MLIPLLIVFYAGELVWRERDAGLSEIADATPVPEWVLFLGKFLGLSLVLVVWMALLMTAGVLGQLRMGYFDFEIGLYLRVLFGLQLIDYLLFALLVFAVHALVNQKHVGFLVALIAYGVITFPSTLGIEHHLLIFGSGPGWSYSDMRGFGPSLGPWLWFKLATAPQVETRAVSFDRPVARVFEDEKLGHRIYTLEQPLQPGDSLQITFEMHFRPRGFRHRGVDTSVVANGTSFTNED